MYGKALRRADMLQEMNFKQSGSHRTSRGRSRSAAREFPLRMIPDTTDNLGSCGVRKRQLKHLRTENYTSGAQRRSDSYFARTDKGGTGHLGGFNGIEMKAKLTLMSSPARDHNQTRV